MRYTRLLCPTLVEMKEIDAKEKKNMFGWLTNKHCLKYYKIQHQRINVSINLTLDTILNVFTIMHTHTARENKKKKKKKKWSTSFWIILFWPAHMMVFDDFSFYYHMLFLSIEKKKNVEFIGITKYAPSIQWLLKIKIYINIYITESESESERMETHWSKS